MRVTYIKRCLNTRCDKKEVCEHGKAQSRFIQYFPNGLNDVPYFMLKDVQAIYPVAKRCPRYNMNRQQLLDLQDSQNQKL